MSSVELVDNQSGVATAWRYVCPDCGATYSQIARRTDTDRVQLNTDGDGVAPYRCEGCTSPQDKLYDKKRDKLVSPNEIHQA
ncbi:hypothetical protein PN419_00600 [Halorubrum ezzemoulense]|uniref:hypothetical protein n=1 Tax=Halorubrum ezzemoulense TaxID=337243 RepID=UPI002330AA15|nr:hypothetical protein [Halorubrum ezzemoulense]MDB9247507.1 hypothetical protein [Halorubrum ezzemoulense]MDB9258584.1 hypothetical protein [Halorubrum ezzemoulense]MDB9264557.1 hypothetical protein [Halorubrum ezzemoulense]MDB9268945.1 hypothetical protein [Halorubrum ezzemoulense]MDB9271525.1 hypothetical protein [Halorubrum ezzemoulense]